MASWSRLQSSSSINARPIIGAHGVKFRGIRSADMAKSPENITLAKELQPGDDSRKLASAWSPLRESVFRALWIATVVSNILRVDESKSTPSWLPLRHAACGRNVDRTVQNDHRPRLKE